MPIKLIVRKIKDPQFIMDRELDDPEITIGRDTKNIIILEDKRKYISKEHAKILFDNGNYYLFDFSRNGTFVNNQRLKSDYPYTLKNGSKFVIGDFSFEVVIREPDDSHTIIISNPFLEEIKTISELIQGINDKYQELDPIFREEFIKEAHDKLLKEIDSSVFKKLSSNMISADQEFPQGRSSGIRQGEIANMLLDYFVKLIQGISKFRMEFIGSTIVQSKDSINMQSREELQKDLFGENTSLEQQKKKVDSFKSECEKIFLHQIALLNGYRESIQKGVLMLYNELNPSEMKEDILKEKIKVGPINFTKKLIPFLVSIQVFKRIQLKFKNINLEDIGFIEKKYFRPSFIRKYLETISSNQKATLNSED